MQNKLKEIRTDAKITQEELSEKSGISRTIISGLENGTIQSITTATMLALARALNTDAHIIFML